MKGFFTGSQVAQVKKEILVPRCGACGLYRKCNSPKMPLYGDGARKVLIVGEAPGEKDDEQGVPFVGEAGAFLKETLGEFRVRLERDTWATNALICHPADGAPPENKQISWCRPNLVQALKDTQPTVIITLGRAALVSVLSPYWKVDEAMESWVGWKIPLANHWVCPTYHPSFLLRMKNQLMDRLFYDHLRAAFKIKEPPPAQEDHSKQIQVLFDDRAVHEALRDIDREGGWVAFDYETNCLKPEYPQAKIYSAAVSNGKRTISYLWSPRTAKSTSMFLQSKRTRKIASNMKFEERFTRKFLGHSIANLDWDTMLAAHVLDNREKITSIKFQAFVLLGVPQYNQHIEGFLKSSKETPYNRIQAAPVHELLFYGGMDAILEKRVAAIQRKEMGYED